MFVAFGLGGCEVIDSKWDSIAVLVVGGCDAWMLLTRQSTCIASTATSRRRRTWEVEAAGQRRRDQQQQTRRQLRETHSCASGRNRKLVVVSMCQEPRLEGRWVDQQQRQATPRSRRKLGEASGGRYVGLRMQSAIPECV